MTKLVDSGLRGLPLGSNPEKIPEIEEPLGSLGGEKQMSYAYEGSHMGEFATIIYRFRNSEVKGQVVHPLVDTRERAEEIYEHYAAIGNAEFGEPLSNFDQYGGKSITWFQPEGVRFCVSFGEANPEAKKPWILTIELSKNV